MHGYNFIEWLIGSPYNDDPLSNGYDTMFCDMPNHYSHHDAMGMVLMGGEL